MRIRHHLTSPLLAMCSAYSYITIISIIMLSMGVYSNSNFFSWGPPINFFGMKIVSQKTFYCFHIMIFFHQLINNWVNSVVYPWIINTIQDPKSKTIPYNTFVSLMLINSFDLYSELDVMLIIMGFTTQISFIFTVTIANIITSTAINYRYIKDKTEETEQLLEIV